MAGDDDHKTQISRLQALVSRQSSDIAALQELVHDADTHAVFRVWGVALLVGLFATTMGTWLAVPVFSTSGGYSTFDSTSNYGFWDVLGLPHETVGGQTGITMALLFALIAVGMAALTAPTVERLYLTAGCAALLLSSEIWLRVGFSGQVAAVVEGGADNSGNVITENAYTYGGPALTLAFLLTGALAVSALSQAQFLRRRRR